MSENNENVPSSSGVAPGEGTAANAMESPGRGMVAATRRPLRERLHKRNYLMMESENDTNMGMDAANANGTAGAGDADNARN